MRSGSENCSGSRLALVHTSNEQRQLAENVWLPTLDAFRTFVGNLPTGVLAGFSGGLGQVGALA